MRFTMTGLTFGNGLVGSRTHDSDFRLTGLSDGSVIDRSYGFDTSGNITAITDNLNALDSQTLDYDNLDRLTDATGNYGDIDFAYDATGNRGSLTLNSSAVDNYGYSTNTHHLSSVTGANPQSFSFGAAGNIVGRNGATHVIDDRGRLASITAGASTTVYTYNARGERVRKSSAGNTTDYVYRGHLLLLESEGAQSREYAYLNGQPLAAWDITGSGETQYYFHNDHLGTPQVMTDTAQAVVWQAAYGPFGEATITTATVENNLRFPGQYFDGESGLHYNYYRYYDPETGRYITSDPIGLKGGLNTYTYVGGNPITLFDFFGLATQAEVNAAVSTLQENYPEAFPNPPTSVEFNELNGLGMTDFFNNITMNSERFGDSSTCVREYDEYQFLQTLAHEMLHVNESWYSRLLSNSFSMGSPFGHFHRQLDDQADAMATQGVIADYLNRRGERESCGCNQ